MSLTFTRYQEAARQTAVYPGRKEYTGLTYATLGLTGEAGEFAEKVKKLWRDHDKLFVDEKPNLWGRLKHAFTNTEPAQRYILPAEKRTEMIKELGDVLWYAAMVADELCIDLDQVAQININKLLDRQNRNRLAGSGDNR